MLKKKILRSLITNASPEAVLKQITDWASQSVSGYVCVANVHMVIEAYCSSAFNQVVNEAKITIPDGKPLSLLMNWLYGTHQTRITGPDLMVELFQACQDQALPVFFYGSTTEILDSLSAKLKREFPQLKVAGLISPPFRALSAEENSTYLDMMTESGAKIVFVALGCPKQERWMAKHYRQFPGIMLGVGAAFPFYSGHLRRCPIWMQSLCLEWLYRLLLEPTRLFKRYCLTNSLFIGLAAMELISVKLMRQKELL